MNGEVLAQAPSALFFVSIVFAHKKGCINAAFSNLAPPAGLEPATQ